MASPARRPKLQNTHQSPQTDQGQPLEVPQLARAAREGGVPFCVSTQSITSVEAIAERAAGTDLWFQLYVWRDRSLTYELLDRAKAAGVETLVLTADTPVIPKKEWNIRNGFGIPITPTWANVIDVAAHPRWFWTVMFHYLSTAGVPAFAHYPAAYRTRLTQKANAGNVQTTGRLTWADVAEIRRRWPGNLVIKGILHADDAENACRAGADGIVVSNHGARNLDAAPAVINVLPQIVDRVDGKITIFADGGVRRGSDIVKYIASGAKAVLVGRALLYGTAVAGENGASGVLQILRDELQRTLGFVGEPDVNQLGQNNLWHS